MKNQVKILSYDSSRRYRVVTGVLRDKTVSTGNGEFVHSIRTDAVFTETPLFKMESVQTLNNTKLPFYPFGEGPRFLLAEENGYLTTGYKEDINNEMVHTEVTILKETSRQLAGEEEAIQALKNKHAATISLGVFIAAMGLALIFGVLILGEYLK